MNRLTLVLFITAFALSCEKDIEVERISYFQKVKDTFDIRILGCADAGYLWFFENEKTTQGLKVIRDSIYPILPDVRGGYNYQVFTLVAEKPGKEVLRFEEYRPWQKWKSIDHRIWYTIHITE